MQDSSEDDTDGDCEVPRLLTPVRLHPTCKAKHRNALLHWASVTPEVQVLPLHLAQQARTWLTQQGRIPADDLDYIGEHSPHLWELMMADADICPPKAGHFWHLAAPLQDLLTRMVQIVEHTVDCASADTPALMPSRDHMTEYILPLGCSRTAPTSFELFLWVSSATRMMHAAMVSRLPHPDCCLCLSTRSSGRGCP